MLLFFCIIALIIIFIIIILLLSEIRITIKNLEVIIDDINKRLNLELKVGIYFFKKIKIFGIKIKNNKIMEEIENGAFKEDLRKKRKFSRKDSKKILLKFLKLLNIDNINLEISVDTESPILTSYLVGVLSIIVPNILAARIKKYRRENYKFKINPIYKNKNYIYMKLDCKISIKIVHIINMLKRILKNERTIKIC